MKNLLNNLFPFYIGQKVVCLKDYSYNNEGGFKKGEIKIVEELIKCSCNLIGVKIRGIKYSLPTVCYDCHKNLNGTFFDSEYFAPLQQKNFPLIKLSQIKENEKTKIKEFEKQILIEN